MFLDKGVLRPRPAIAGRQVVAKNVQKKQGISIARMQRLLTTGNPSICLVRSLGGIGDVLMTTPTVRALKHQWPGSHITYATDFHYMDGALRDILLYNPYIDELVQYQAVSAKEFDFKADITSVCLQYEKSGVKGVPNRIDLFAQYVGVGLNDSGYLPIYTVAEEEKRWAQEKLRRYPRHSNTSLRIGIQVRPSTLSRAWPLDRVRDLAINLNRNLGAQVCMFDSSHGQGPAEAWNISGLIPFKDYKIRQVAALMNEMDLIVAPDSGLMHIAGALNKKLVTLWAGTDPNSRINHYPNAVAIEHEYACSPCVVGESKVLTDTGYKQIGDIEVGEKVKTAHGTYNIVTKVHKNKRNFRQLFEILPSGTTETLCVTEDHKLLISPGQDKYYCPASYNPNPGWIMAKDIQVGDFLCIPKTKCRKTCHTTKDIKDLLWLYGIYMAEGDIRMCQRSYMTRFTLGAHEDQTIDRIRDIVFRIFSRKASITDKRPKENTKVIDISCKELYYQIIDLFGQEHSSSTKKIPDIIFTIDQQYADIFFSGYFGGDGSKERKYDKTTGWKIYSTASEDIAYGIQEYYACKGLFAKIYKRVRDTNYKKNAIIYRIFVKEESHNTRVWTVDDDYIYVPIRDIFVSDRDDEYVYDISVKDDPTFTVNNFAVYDCWYSAEACARTYPCLKSITVDEVYKAVCELLDQETKYEVLTPTTTDQRIEDIDICIIRDDGIGDVTACLPAFSAFKKKHPDKKIALATMASNTDLMNLSGCFDRVIPMHTKWQSVAHNNILDARDLFEKNKPKNSNFCYIEDIPRPAYMGQFLGVEPDYNYRLPKSRQGIKSIESKLKEQGLETFDNLISIQLAGTCKARSWLPEYYKPFALQVREMGFVPVLLGSRIDYGLNLFGCINFTGQLSVLEFNSIISMSRAFVGVDSGGVHLAAANNIPFVAIFNAIPPELRLAEYRNYRLLFPKDMDCAPCWDRGCNEMTCMKNFTPDIVANELQKLLEEI